MNLRLRSIESRTAAQELIEPFAKAVFETTQALHEEAEEARCRRDAENWIARSDDEEASLMLVGEKDGEVLATAASAPFVDPLSGTVVPMLVVLWVDPTIRHRGVARALVVELRRILAQRGFDVLTARAGAGDDAVLSMGERWGLVRQWEFLSSD